MTREEKEPLTAGEVTKAVVCLAAPALAVALAYGAMMALYQVLGG